MTTLFALVSGSGWHVADLKRAARELGIRLHAVPFPLVSATAGGVEAGGTGKTPRIRPRVSAGRFDLTACDGVLVRMMPPGSLEQVVFRMDALQTLAALGVPVLNPPRAVEAAVDKYLSLALLEAAGLAVPATWIGEAPTEALDAFDDLGADVVVKPLFGSEGRGLVRISDREIAWRTFHALCRVGAVLYLQRFVRHPGHDLRVFVLKGSILAAMRRRGTPGDWRTNVSRGGRAEPCRLDEDARHTALEAARAVRAELAGIDLVHDLDSGRYVVLEVNAVPGWRALSRVTGIDVAAAILRALRDSGR
jgi:tetrahydromethanopterin:alpha-L-glutamate ligase